MAVCDWCGYQARAGKSRAGWTLNRAAKMTLNKAGDLQRNFPRSARKARPKAGKTDPKVLLATLAKRLSFGVRHRFS